MNESKVRTELHKLVSTASELAAVCDREVPEFARQWHAVARNARALESEADLSLVRGDLESLVDTVERLFGYHPDAFTERYIVRANLDEQEAENAKFDALKDSVLAAARAVGEALPEGEINKLAVRRHLTGLETIFLDGGYRAEASHARALLNAEWIDLTAVGHFADELACRKWIGLASSVQNEVDRIVGDLKAELSVADRSGKR
jgi:hypothetical protein